PNGRSQLFPDRTLVARQTQAIPDVVDPLDHGLVHADLLAPFALGLGLPLVGGVQPDLGAQAALGAGEVQIVDRGVLDDGDVARRVHLGRDGPHDVLPVAGVDVVVHDDDPLGVHELAQIAPAAHHHALGVARIGFLHR